MPDHNEADELTFPFGEALRREYTSIWPHARDDAGQPVRFDDAKAYLDRVLADAHPRQSALCLSGGGIRSAAFCLGVIQSLAGQGLLARFHYLSAVSGGGYIGAWLQSCLLARARQRDPTAAITKDDVNSVQTELAGPIQPRGPIDLLRGFTGYLTPQPGLASPDTWAGLILWTRNTLINWAVFGPALFALALLPLAYRDALPRVPDRAAWYCLAFALLMVGISAFGACSDLPSHTPPRADRAGPDYARPGAILWRVALPSWIWAVCLPFAVAPVLPLDHGAAPQALTASLAGMRLGPAMVVALTTCLVLHVAYGVAWGRAAILDRGAELFAANLGAWTCACVIACAFLGAGVPLASMSVATLPSPLDAAWVAVCGPIWAMAAHLSLSAVFVALRSKALRGDLDREWLARLSGLKIVPVLLAATLMAVCLVLPHFLFTTKISQFNAWVTGAFTTVSGVAAALFGKSAKTPFAMPGGRSLLSVQTAAGVATLIFAVGLFVLLAAAGGPAVMALRPYLPVLARLPVCVQTALLAGASLLLAWLLGRQVNVNRFSLHNIYRNRLARAFIGSGWGTQGGGTRDPFTGFDPADNPRLHTLKGDGASPRRLFPVIGTSLNLISGARRDWAERKAAPFTMTPVACGSESLKARRDMHGKGGRFVDPQDYGGAERETGEAGEELGMTLGTAMAVSGAAVSPSMGYHSSPATSLLMTLFNARLGVWLPNPATTARGALQFAQPPNALWSLLNEMLGRVGDKGSSIYLSDGGHFDNLGLYEMVRRGCRLIVVVDAGEDGDLRYGDLGDALRKIRIDQQVEIAFPNPIPIAREADWGERSRPFMLGRITWTEPVRTSGRLLYIKPSLFEGIPVDLRAYARIDPTFPNETTANQFFTESKFESYRKLGQWIGDKLRDPDYAGPAIAEMLEELRGHDTD